MAGLQHLAEEEAAPAQQVMASKMQASDSLCRSNLIFEH